MKPFEHCFYVVLLISHKAYLNYGRELSQKEAKLCHLNRTEREATKKRTIMHIAYRFVALNCLLLFLMLYSDSADDKLMVFFLFFLENRLCHVMQIASLRDNWHERSNLFSRKNQKTISKCRVLKFLPSMQRVKSWLNPRELIHSTTLVRL